MRPKPTSTHNAQKTDRRNRPAELYRHAGEHPAFDPGFVDATHGVIWYELPGDWPACLCGMPAAAGRLDCGDAACPGLVL